MTSSGLAKRLFAVATAAGAVGLYAHALSVARRAAPFPPIDLRFEVADYSALAVAFIIVAALAWVSRDVD